MFWLALTGDNRRLIVKVGGDEDYEIDEIDISVGFGSVGG
jgi:hypothetical protein